MDKRRDEGADTLRSRGGVIVMNGVPDGIRTRIGPLAAGVLAVGLVVAIATDGQLPEPWTRAMLGVLLVLDGIMIEWLTRPSRA